MHSNKSYERKSNILVSGLVYQRGKTYQLLRMALDGEVSMTFPQPILDEMADVLARKFQMSEDFIAKRKTSLRGLLAS